MDDEPEAPEGALTEQDLDALVLYLLGRGASLEAKAEMMRRDLFTNLAYVVTGAEFAGLVAAGLRGQRIRHEERGVRLDLAAAWFARNFDLRRATLAAMTQADGWAEALRHLVLDEMLRADLARRFPQRERLERFERLVAEVSEPQGPAAAPQPADAGDDAPVPEPVLDLAAVPSVGALRTLLTEVYRGSSYRTLVRWARDLAQAPPENPAYGALVEAFAARTYLKLFVAERAYETAQALRRDAARFALLPQSEQLRLDKTLAVAALRSGRAEEGVRHLETTIDRHRGDWELYYMLGEALVGTDPGRAVEELEMAVALNGNLQPGHRLAIADYLLQAGHVVRARTLAIPLFTLAERQPELEMLHANLALHRAEPDRWRDRLAAAFEAQGLCGACLRGADPVGLFGFGPSPRPAAKDHPLVSVVMTTFNSEATVRGAVASVLAQTAANLELIVVDDCSTDRTREILAGLARTDPRLRTILNTENGGTYRSKNAAIREARGAFVTLHDSDDWMHPERLARHLAAMGPQHAMSMSNWIRMAGDGQVLLRRGGTYVHKNPASTFFRREVFERVGYFDSVRVGADSEMLSRMQIAYGPAGLTDLPLTLGIGLHHEASLTQSGAGAFDQHRYSEVRTRYAEAWVEWHLTGLFGEGARTMPFPLPQRPFAVPEAML